MTDHNERCCLCGKRLETDGTNVCEICIVHHLVQAGPSQKVKNRGYRTTAIIQ